MLADVRRYRRLRRRNRSIFDAEPGSPASLRAACHRLRRPWSSRWAGAGEPGRALRPEVGVVRGFSAYAGYMRTRSSSTGIRPLDGVSERSAGLGDVRRGGLRI